MKGRTIFGLVLLWVCAGEVHAANVAVITTPPGIMSVLIFLCACACVIVGLQVKSVVRGGLLSKGWQFFIGGFAALALAELAGLLRNMEVITLPVWVVPGLLVLMAGVFLLGLFETKRVLE